MLPATCRVADPWLLGLLLAVPVLAVAHRLRRPDRLGRGVVLSTLAPLAGVRPGWRVRLRPSLGLLRLLAIALLIVGLARPQTTQANARLAAALKTFLASRKDDRVGLVVFKAESKPLSPLTTDYRTLAADARRAAGGDGSAERPKILHA